MTTPTGEILSVRDAMRIRLADESRGEWFQRAGRIRFELGESETALAVRISQLLNDPVAIATMPQECARLRRLRDARRQQRSLTRMPR